jgi:hypothetical protein
MSSDTDSSAPAHTTTDPATCAAETPEETPHACMDGWVYMGFVEGEDEQIDRVPCRRCRLETL